jgi:hypothetical protein
MQSPAASLITDINIVSGSRNHGFQHGLRQQQRLQTSTWLPPGRSFQETYSRKMNNSSSPISCLLGAKMITWLRSAFGAEPVQALDCLKPPCQLCSAIPPSLVRYGWAPIVVTTTISLVLPPPAVSAAPFCHLSHLSIGHSFVNVVMKTTVCYTVYYFAQTALPANIYRKDSMIWCKISKVP